MNDTERALMERLATFKVGDTVMRRHAPFHSGTVAGVCCDDEGVLHYLFRERGMISLLRCTDLRPA